MFIEGDNAPERDYYDELFLHKEVRLSVNYLSINEVVSSITLQKMGYRLNLKTKECQKYTLNEPFREVGVPLGARMVGELEIGTAAIPGAGVRVQVYEMATARGESSGDAMCDN